ncbi:MAG: hypothetical protein HY541_05845 [Deltaproteobacteria bacterium]|nr:hypothetical protein [Deltaproteobacteria bacterium]
MSDYTIGTASTGTVVVKDTTYDGVYNTGEEIVLRPLDGVEITDPAKVNAALRELGLDPLKSGNDLEALVRCVSLFKEADQAGRAYSNILSAQVESSIDILGDDSSPLHYLPVIAKNTMEAREIAAKSELPISETRLNEIEQAMPTAFGHIPDLASACAEMGNTSCVTSYFVYATKYNSGMGVTIDESYWKDTSKKAEQNKYKYLLDLARKSADEGDVSNVLHLTVSARSSAEVAVGEKGLSETLDRQLTADISQIIQDAYHKSVEVNLEAAKKSAGEGNLSATLSHIDTARASAKEAGVTLDEKLIAGIADEAGQKYYQREYNLLLAEIEPTTWEDYRFHYQYLIRLDKQLSEVQEMVVAASKYGLSLNWESDRQRVCRGYYENCLRMAEVYAAEAETNAAELKPYSRLSYYLGMEQNINSFLYYARYLAEQGGIPVDEERINRILATTQETKTKLEKEEKWRLRRLDACGFLAMGAMVGFFIVRHDLWAPDQPEI